MAIIDTLFMTKTAENHTLWGRTYLYSPYKGLPPPPDQFAAATHLFGSSDFIMSSQHYAPLLFSRLGSLFLLFVLSFSQPIQFKVVSF